MTRCGATRSTEVGYLVPKLERGRPEMRNDDILYMRTVLERPKNRALTKDHYCPGQNGDQDVIPAGFEWDGSSSGILAPIFPRHNHPIASCRHDYRCGKAKCPEDRKWADEQFEKDVGETSWWVTKKVGYIGVRVGAFFGIGVNY